MHQGSGLALAPLFQPLLPLAALARFAGFVGIDTQIERGEGSARSFLSGWPIASVGRSSWPKLPRSTKTCHRMSNAVR